MQKTGQTNINNKNGTRDAKRVGDEKKESTNSRAWLRPRRCGRHAAPRAARPVPPFAAPPPASRTCCIPNPPPWRCTLRISTGGLPPSCLWKPLTAGGNRGERERAGTMKEGEGGDGGDLGFLWLLGLIGEQRPFSCGHSPGIFAGEAENLSSIGPCHDTLCVCVRACGRACARVMEGAAEAN